MDYKIEITVCFNGYLVAEQGLRNSKRVFLTLKEAIECVELMLKTMP